MKVCIITQNIGTLGGVQVVVRSMTEYLVKEKKCEVTLLMPDVRNNASFGNLQMSGICIDDLDNYFKFKEDTIGRGLRMINRKSACFDHVFFNRMHEWLLFSSSEEEKLVKYLNQNHFDWVIGTAFNYSLLVAHISNRINAKTCGWMHSTFDGYYGTKGTAYYGLQNLNRKYLPRLDRVFVLNQYDKARFDEHYGVNSFVLHDPIVLNASKRSETNDNELLFAGRLNIQVKGIDYLIEIIKLLKERRNDFHLTVVGKGAGSALLRNEIHEHELEENITLVGYQSDMTPYYKKARIVLSTSRWEGFGMTIVEAMSYGIPSIAFDNDGPKDIITQDVNGILVPCFDIAKFVDRIEEMLDDNIKYAQMSHNAFERAKDFSIAQIGDRMFALLEEFTSHSR